MTVGLSEKDIQQGIINQANRRPDVRLFRNNIGIGFQGNVLVEENGKIILANARRIRFGLQEFSGDLIGWKSMKITPDMVGLTVAVFVSEEVKSPTGRIGEGQKNWTAQVIKAGGIAKIVRSIEDGAEI